MIRALLILCLFCTTGYAQLTCPVVSSLATLNSLVDGQTVYLQGYHTADDEGGQLLVYHDKGQNKVVIDGGFYFEGQGKSYFEATDKTRVHAKRFGVRSSNKDNSLFLTNALQASSRYRVPLEIPQGVYETTACVLKDFDNITIVGEGTLKAKSPRWAGAILTFDSCNDIRISGITIDCNKPAMKGDVTYGSNLCMGVSLSNVCSRVTIQDCTFKNLYTNHLWLNNANNLRFINNRCFSTEQDQNQQCEFLSVVTVAGDNVIQGNRFEVASVTSPALNAAGIKWSGQNIGTLDISQNRFKNCGRDNAGSHRVGVIDLYADVSYAYIGHNECENSVNTFIRVQGSQNIRVEHNCCTSQFTPKEPVILVSPSVAGGHCKDISIKHNRLVVPKCINIQLSTIDPFYTNKNIVVAGNDVDGSILLYRCGEDITIDSNRASSINYMPGRETPRPSSNCSIARNSVDQIQFILVSGITVKDNKVADVPRLSGQSFVFPGRF